GDCFNPRANSKTRSKTSAVAMVPPVTLFGSPVLLAGEDDAAYHELLSRVRTAISPVDIIDEMFIADVVSLEWEILRWRRLKSSLMQTQGLEAREQFLSRDEPDADDKVNQILASINLDMDDVLKSAQARKAGELAQDYLQRKQGAIKLIDKLLASAGSSIDALMVQALPMGLDKIERIDHLTTIAEPRRNAMLREIDRRRAVLSEVLRRQVQEVEGEYEVVEQPPGEAKSAA